MPKATIDKVVPAFKLLATGDQTIASKDLKGKRE